MSDLDDIRQDPMFRVLKGLGEMPGSRRMGEFLCRFREPDLVQLRELAVCWLGPLLSMVARQYREGQGFVPAFIGGTDIEVDGKCFEGATRCHHGVRRYQMHTVFVENLIVSLRLNGCDCHTTHG